MDGEMIQNIRERQIKIASRSAEEFPFLITFVCCVSCMVYVTNIHQPLQWRRTDCKKAQAMTNNGNGKLYIHKSNYDEETFLLLYVSWIWMNVSKIGRLVHLLNLLTPHCRMQKFTTDWRTDTHPQTYALTCTANDREHRNKIQCRIKKHVIGLKYLADSRSVRSE